MRWLEQKRDQMRQRLKTEPDQVREGYQLRDVRIFPLGLLYLLPYNLVKDGGR